MGRESSLGQEGLVGIGIASWRGVRFSQRGVCVSGGSGK